MKNAVIMLKVMSILLLFMLSQHAQAQEVFCGVSDQPCKVDLGSYYAAVPERKVSQGLPALLFFHGAGQSGAIVRNNNQEMLETFVEAGFVVLLPNGLKRPGNRFGPGWSFLTQFKPLRDELLFSRQVIADAQKRFNVDPSRVVVSGYSIGASLTWVLACKDAALGKAYASVAGGFWRPLPETCNGPVNLLHTHGWRDKTVPLEGRPLRDGDIFQGDIYAGLAVWREVNGCKLLRADSFETDGPFWRRIWEQCESGKLLEFMLHSGGHNVPEAWAGAVVNWFQDLENQDG